jgi:hypothetical protein
LGDIRYIRDVDEDIKLRPGAKPFTLADYQRNAWQDFIENQVKAFKIPFFLGIGNHETIAPKTRGEFIEQFADWLEAPVLQEQRLKDNPDDHWLKTYFHWQKGNVDFIYLDNATTDQFDEPQLAWFDKVIGAAEANSSIKTIVVGMHEALPDSLAAGHSMSEYPVGIKSGRHVYTRLLEAQRRGKFVYVLASHSHFLMQNIFDTPYWQTQGGVLPGWIIGTAGAVRYALPEGAKKLSPFNRTNVYGYLLGTVNPKGSPSGTIRFEFREIKEADAPGEVKTKFGDALVKKCFEENTNVPDASNAQ